MDELDNVAQIAENFEQQHQQQAQAASAPPQAELSGQSSEEAAANMAETVLTVGLTAVKLFCDSRLEIGKAEIESGRESLAPVIQKYDLTATGDGKLPFWQEITAGLYLGGLFRRIKRALSEFKALDKAKREQQKQAENNQTQANYGQEREYIPQESSHAVPGEVGLRQVTNPNPNERFI